MKYTIYADGSYSAEQQRAGCGYLILTGRNYIDSAAVKVNCKTPTHAEILAVGLAIKYLIDNIELNKTDVVEFNTDCIHVIEFYEKYKKEGAKRRSGELTDCVKNMARLSELCETRICKVRGHKNSLNPNTIVDRLAKIARGRK